jgi:CHC2 zinc finger
MPARSLTDASLTDRVSADPLLLVPPPVYFERLTGLRVRRSGKLRCLFHDDRHPSLHVYPEAGRGWYCFGCGRGGSVYDLAALLWLTGQSGGGGSVRKLRGREFLWVRHRLAEMFLVDGPGGAPSASMVRRRSSSR